jgi:hypothetical protein
MICDPILVQVKADDSTDVKPYLAVLDEVQEITENSDMPDVVRAKLYKARAFALRNGTADEQATALELLRRALNLDSGAGVKKLIDKLARQVKKPLRKMHQAVRVQTRAGAKGAIIRLQQRRK